MRRLLAPLAVLSLVGLAACEDGPYQPFQPAPQGAGDQWNNGNSPGVVDPGMQGFKNQNPGGTTKQDLCTAPVKAKRWKQMVSPGSFIVPPYGGAGLDLAGGDLTHIGNETWNGLTVEEAEKTNCQGIDAGDYFGDGNLDIYWGDNGEVLAEYLISTRKIIQLSFLPGYEGLLKFGAGAEAFQIQINTPIAKNGKQFLIDWNATTCKSATDAHCFDHEANEIYNALVATYAPSLPQDKNCRASGTCIRLDFGDVAAIFLPPLGLGLWVDNQHAPQPQASEISRIDISLTKTLGFTLANPILKLDGAGPTAEAGTVGHATHPCTLAMGLTYKDFLNDCVDVTGDAKKNVVEDKKLLAGISHDTERYYFDVQGVDLNFVASSLGPTQTVRDNDRPRPDDVAADMDINQFTLGAIRNDYLDDDPAKGKDLHGSGLVYLEYARLVQDGLNQYIDPAKRHALGDPACLAPAVDPQALVFPDGCTGFEGFVTASPPTGDAQLDVLALGPQAAAVNPNLALGLKPGHPQAIFCLDASGDLNTGYYQCNAPQGGQGDMFVTSYARVLQVLGRGNPANLPPDAQDVRFFWKAYATALFKYFEAVGAGHEDFKTVEAQPIDANNLFFDSQGAGQFEIAEYIDRRFASKTVSPIDVRITADVRNDIMNDYDFTRQLYRGERAIYTAMLESQADGPGQESSALLTNAFGSPLLASAWHASMAGKSAYHCATTFDPGQCDNQVPPLDASGNVLLDEQGRPLLQPYKGAFAGSGTSFTLGQTKVRVKSTYANIGQAMLEVPLHQDPYDPSSPSLGTMEALLPWVTKQPGIGFPISITGTLDKFVESYQADFSGSTITAVVDYDYVVDPATGQPQTDPATGKPTGALQFEAVETTDFLGEVFLCQDPNTGDLLHVRMYTPVATILNWFQAHPAAYSACGMITRYSPFGNFADYVTSTSNGVRLGITQGGGYGRVVDVTLFVPGQ